MRRRQKYAELQKPDDRETTQVLSEPIKGQCPKCLKIIGRGLHFHEKACRGNVS